MNLKKIVSMIASAVLFVTSFSVNGIAAEAETTNILIDDSVKIVEYTGASNSGNTAWTTLESLDNVISSAAPSTNNGVEKWLSGSLLKSANALSNPVTYIVIDLGEKDTVTAENIELLWFNGAYGQTYTIETSDSFVPNDNPDVMSRNGLTVYGTSVTKNENYDEGWTVIATEADRTNRDSQINTGNHTVTDTLTVSEGQQQLQRYVRLSVTSMNSGAGFHSTGIRKIRIYGTRTAATQVADAEFKSASASLNGTIGVNFYVQVNNKSILSDLSVKLTKGTNIEETSLSDVTAENGLYKITYNVAAKEMTDVITAEICNGTETIATEELSVKSYAEKAKEIYSDDTKFIALIDAMLDYGTCAQKEFEYNTTNLATGDKELNFTNVNLENTDIADVQITESEGGPDIVGASLLLESDTVLRFYMSLPEGKEVEDYNAGDYALTEKNNLVYVDITDISAKNLDEVYTLTVNEGSVEKASISYSPLNYVKSVIDESSDENLVNVVKALYVYNQCANNYF